jgi:hypothetical protein
MWCIPPTANAEFVYHMEDVLDVYHRPADPQHPVVCLATKQLIGEEPLPAKPGEVERCDCEYTARPPCSSPSIPEPGARSRSLITAVAPTGHTLSRTCWTAAIATSTR